MIKTESNRRRSLGCKVWRDESPMPEKPRAGVEFLGMGAGSNLESTVSTIYLEEHCELPQRGSTAQVFLVFQILNGHALLADTCWGVYAAHRAYHKFARSLTKAAGTQFWAVSEAGVGEPPITIAHFNDCDKDDNCNLSQTTKCFCINFPALKKPVFFYKTSTRSFSTFSNVIVASTRRHLQHLTTTVAGWITTVTTILILSKHY